MKRRNIFIGLLLSLVNWTMFTSAAQAGSSQIPKVSIKGVGIPDLNTANLTGKVTIINFWATWCAACKDELKEMGEVLKPMSDSKDVRLAFVSVDKDPAKAKAWLKANEKAIGADFTKFLYQDSDFKVAQLFEIENFPMTVVIDAKGQIMHIQKGFQNGSNSTKGIYAAAKKLL